MTDMDPIEAMESNYSPEDSCKIVRTALLLAEAYFAWSFEPRSSLKLGVLGDCIQTAFRNYLEAAHPDAYAQLKLAEKGFRLPRIVID